MDKQNLGNHGRRPTSSERDRGEGSEGKLETPLRSAADRAPLSGLGMIVQQPQAGLAALCLGAPGRRRRPLS